MSSSTTSRDSISAGNQINLLVGLPPRSRPRHAVASHPLLVRVAEAVPGRRRTLVKRWTLILAAAFVLTAAAKEEGRWRTIGPGGGGALFHPTISPHDPRTVLVACDMTGSYITADAGGRWHIFNLGLSAQFFLFDPIDPRVIYAKAGALFRSTDGGTSWTRFFPSTVTKITMGDDHAAPTLHVAGAPRGEIGAMAIDPGDSRVLYLAIESALWTSPNRGATWQKSADLPGQVRQMWIDPRSSNSDRTLYVAGPDAIYRRQAGGWRTGASPGIFTDVTGTPPRFYATAAGKIFVSADGGLTWSPSSLPGFQGRATAIAASPRQPDVAYVSYSGLRAPIRATSGVAKTVDGGRHWTPVWHNVRDAWLSERFDGEWPGNPRGLAVAPSTPDVVYATDDGRTLRTLDGGASWEAVYSIRTPDGGWTTNGLDITTNYGVHFDPFDPRHMFIGYTDIGLFASDNGGASWYSATRSGVPESWVNTTYWMEFDPNVRGRMWAVMSGVHDLPRAKMWRQRSPETYDGGVVRSDDGGRTWRVQNTGMPQTAATHILRDPVGTLYVTGFGRGVFKSTDGGERWALKNAGIEGAQPFAWRLARDTKGTLYLVVARRSDDGSFANAGDGALYRSTDSAERWTRLPLPQGVNGPNGLAIDPQDSGRLYLAAWGRSVPQGAADGGIYLSTDAGATWRRVLAQDEHVYDVTIDPRDPRVLYAAGFEASAWRSSDRGLTWRRIPGFDFKWAHRVIVDPRDPARIFITTFGGSVWYGTAD
jgi:photosystem II stability/assembly factor-like uncharacterized protein